MSAPPSQSVPAGPNWEGMWQGIIGGGPQLWKAEEAERNFATHLTLLQKHGALLPPAEGTDSRPDHIFAPLCGDSPFVAHAMASGVRASATGVDLVDTALLQMRSRFTSGDPPTAMPWASGEAELPYHEVAAGAGAGAGVRLYQGDVLTPLAGEAGRATVVYDKDSLGALPKDIHADYKQRLVSYMHPAGCTALVSGVRRETEGPPHDLGPEDAVWAAEAKSANLKAELLETVTGAVTSTPSGEWQGILYIVRYSPVEAARG